ncbi:hemerythrin domain-containing protein [Vibrio tapetis subsp. quintayensis]|uniref:hemerythrin domain-containing protein n=1 Tax=Vibrio tapetis TaxID=52443 RepID=UPI0025B45D88|nr:hemerythrin domain-containing protein [Vibrio tapetis]MDN3682730.1 hemerythrin domain-containing protein [Vibrio tapetis subsp. quintayensis]
MMLERIRREHGYMMRLLAILNKKLVALRNEQSVNYSLLKEVVDYLSNHSEKVHHPKEDILYLYYQAHYKDIGTIKNLEQEHKDLSGLTDDFLNTIDMILQDAVVPLDMFADRLEEFITRQKQHLEIEEKEILPLIDKHFTHEDWKAVELQWQAEDDDPVFGETIAERYKQLAERVKASDLVEN